MGLAQGVIDGKLQGEFPYLRVDVDGQVVLSKKDIDKIAEAVFGRVKALLAEGVEVKSLRLRG